MRYRSPGHGVIANDDNKFKLGVNFLVEGAVGKTGLKK